jgi:hypothetical protein
MPALNSKLHTWQHSLNAKIQKELAEKGEPYGVIQERDSIIKTDKSKTSCFTFDANKKLKLDRPSPKKWSVRDKTISCFVHTDKH